MSRFFAAGSDTESESESSGDEITRPAAATAKYENNISYSFYKQLWISIDMSIDLIHPQTWILLYVELQIQQTLLDAPWNSQ